METRLRAVAAALLCLIAPIQGAAQVADFKVAWTTIGEVGSGAGREATTLQPGTKVVRVDVQPTIIEVAVGKQVCIASLQILAFAADGRPVAGAPLLIAVRQDHKPQLQLTHLQGICMRPARKGEYPIRFTSRLPAPDDTLRGAQVFLRAS
jgi:hypothetical protein